MRREGLSLDGLPHLSLDISYSTLAYVRNAMLNRFYMAVFMVTTNNKIEHIGSGAIGRLLGSSSKKEFIEDMRRTYCTLVPGDRNARDRIASREKTMREQSSIASMWRGRWDEVNVQWGASTKRRPARPFIMHHCFTLRGSSTYRNTIPFDCNVGTKYGFIAVPWRTDPRPSLRTKLALSIP